MEENPKSNSSINSLEDNLSLLTVTDTNVGIPVVDDLSVAETAEIENYNDYNNNCNSNRIRFPVRPQAEDCAFYIKTGMCKFGVTCKFNHPSLPKFPQLGGNVDGNEEYFDNVLEFVKERDDYVDKQPRVYCKYFDRPGGCKYGKTCKFTHSRKPSPASELNFMGLPIRQGEKDCPFYICNGSCKFGASCRFNHPAPTSVGGLDSLPSPSSNVSISSPSASPYILKSWSPAALKENSAYMPLMLQPTQGILPRRELAAYLAPVYRSESIEMASTYTMNRQPSERNVYPHHPEQMLGEEFPERPGEPECSYFIKTGNCKYKSACKFHHPKNASEKSSAYSLSELGLPLRPGESMCSYYSRYGICKYGPVCKYDHPVNYAQSAVCMTPCTASSIVNNHAMTAGS